MSTVFASPGMTLDGFVAGPNARPGNPLGDGGLRIHEWVEDVETWRERQSVTGGTGTGGDQDDGVVRETFERAGAYVMGRRMFAEGEVGWPDPPPFRAPVFVLTHTPREPWVRQGGTTFHFVTEGPGSPKVTHVRYRITSSEARAGQGKARQGKARQGKAIHDHEHGKGTAA
ncbi:hypothetical protein [Streptomyces sp. SAJ15]|uniref:hypothetical protein n=1 Tax=Streptomyces sp. SAJ15 TaxID=2011095 RepID=UPI0016432F23|nr:hypothetical protein [Streptomyces sp. SAJ15]